MTKDRNGNQLVVGGYAKWYDPDESYRDLERVYEIVKISGDDDDAIVLIADGFSEAEVLPSELMVVDGHRCSICGKPMEWDDNIWINSSFGVCQDCYEKIPEDVRENISDENYDEKTKKYLDDLGAIY